MKSVSRPRRISVLVSALCLAAVALFARPAHAGSVTGLVTQTGWHSNGESWAPQLSIQLSSGSFSYAQTSSPGCSLPANTIDVLKGFLSVAQAAQLAGKNVVILFGSCFGNQYIYEIQMQH